MGYIKINTYICIDGSPDENQTALDFTFHIVYATKFAPILQAQGMAILHLAISQLIGILIIPGVTFTVIMSTPGVLRMITRFLTASYKVPFLIFGI